MTRVALCQVNTTIGAFSRNIELCIAFLAKAAQENAELAVFPELALSSYPPLDLLDRPDFIEASQTALKSFFERLPAIPNCPRTVILGSIVPNAGNVGRAIQNASIVIHEGRVVLQQAKRLLPTYDVFDEARYFQPGEACSFWESPWGKLGISVCEDAWFSDEHMGRRIYRTDPAVDLKGADLVVNTSASPFELNKRERRRENFSGFVRRTGAPVIFVNQVGGNDEILFDGLSAIYSPSGDILFEMPAFAEALAIVDFSVKPKMKIESTAIWRRHSGQEWEAIPSSLVRSVEGRYDDTSAVLHDALVTGIRDYFVKTGFSKAVLGLSGGIDSAVVACLAAEALGAENVLTVSLPTQYSSTHSLTDAEALARNVGVEYRVVSLKFIYSTLLMELKPHFKGAEPDFTEENIQARLRAVMIMALANKRRALALTTGNKSELGVGYCTTYGDMAGALAPLGDVYKTKVYELAHYINTIHPGWIPESSITKPPSAELRPDQTDQDTLPPYDVLDQILALYFEGLSSVDSIVAAGFDRGLVEKIITMVRQSEFKRRQAAPVLKVTSKAFGIGRRMPVAKSF